MMDAPTHHLLHGIGSGSYLGSRATACGLRDRAPELVHRSSEPVTCGRCMRTFAFRFLEQTGTAWRVDLSGLLRRFPNLLPVGDPARVAPEGSSDGDA